MTTKEKVLIAASEEFAVKGYHAATIRDICEMAGVNIAAVNYHFSSKETLYQKVYEFLFEKTEKEYPREINLDIASEEEWHNEIKSFLLQVMRKCTSDNKYERYLHTIFAREELSPSDQFPEIYQRLLAPRLDDIKYLFSYGKYDSDEELNISVFSIISIVLCFAEKRSLVGNLTGNPNFGADNLEIIVENLFAGIVASIKFKGKKGY